MRLWDKWISKLFDCIEDKGNEAAIDMYVQGFQYTIEESFDVQDIKNGMFTVKLRVGMFSTQIPANWGS